MSAEKPAQAVDTAPDPDEDDLDDLDDVLDQFDATKIEHEAAPAASSPGRPVSSGAGAVPAPPATLNLDGEDEFAKQLQAGMAELLGDLDSDPAMKKQFEELMKGIDTATAQAAEDVVRAEPSSSGSPPAPSASTADPQAPYPDATFQDTIRRTMERLQNSGEAAGAAAQSASEDDILAQMLKEMGTGGEGSEDDFSKMLMGMMEQLTNKDILYEPMKELHDKFPDWLAANGDQVPEDDMKRYREQHTLVNEIVERFERKGYSDQDTGDREYIVERMQKMQAAGAPPPDLVGDMNAAQEAMGELDQGCATQ